MSFAARFARTAGAIFLGLRIAMSCQGVAAQQTPVSPEIERGLAQAAREGGPRALLDRLSQILAATPELAADPQRAAELARAAALPVAQFAGANLPIYRDIATKIVDTAPAGVRAAVANSVIVVVTAVAMSDPYIREPLSPPQLRRIIQPAPRRPAAPTRGVRAGSFVVYPEIAVTEFWDDNIFATKTGEVRDYVTVVSPHVLVASDWKEHAVSFEAHMDATRYHSHSKEDTKDYWVAGEGRFDISNLTNVFGGGVAGKFHEDRESPDDVNGTEPTDFRDYSAFAGVSHQFGNFVLRPGVNWRRLRFEDTPSTTVTFNNSDRDRDTISEGMRLGYRIDDVFQPFIDAHREDRLYRSDVDDNGFDRDSSGYRITAGTTVRLAGKLDAEMYVGWLNRNYDDRTLRDIQTSTFGGNVRWRPLSPLFFTFWVDRTIEETTLFGSSSYIFTGGGATLEYSVTSDLLVTLRGSLGHSDFQGVDRLDRDLDTSIGLRYTIYGGLYAAGDYRYQRRLSSIDTVDYRRHQIFLRLGYRY